jgi:hypothetical protein
VNLEHLTFNRFGKYISSKIAYPLISKSRTNNIDPTIFHSNKIGGHVVDEKMCAGSLKAGDDELFHFETL